VELPYLQILVLAVCAITFYRMGRHERSWGLLWAALSLATSFIVMFVFRGGVLSVFLAQAIPFVGITAWRMWKSP
jgi:hypothetical protein